MKYNHVTRVISVSLEQSSASDSLPRRVAAGMGVFEYRFYAENGDLQPEQPHMRKAWATIGDRERA
jgi:hypothetical protein